MDKTKLQNIIKSNVYYDFDDCWIWLGVISDGNYARLNVAGITYSVHRLVLTVFKNIPQDKIHKACHTCNIKRCVNPDHIYNGTILSNARDRKLAEGYPVTTHCPRGHEYTKATTYYFKNGRNKGKKYCKICRRKPNGYIARRYK
jgi:hypothetical protein